MDARARQKLEAERAREIRAKIRTTLELICTAISAVISLAAFRAGHSWWGMIWAIAAGWWLSAALRAARRPRWRLP